VKTVAEVLAAKKQRIYTIEQTASVFDALETLAKENLGALLVTNKAAAVGIFSERDYARRIVLEGRDPQKTTVREVMTQPLIDIDQESSVEQALEVMRDRQIRHLAIISEKQEPVGLLSLLDLTSFILEIRDKTINDLEDYVSETWPF